MSENYRESLSALMDNEADELELRRVLKAMPDDMEIQATWKRYHLVRAHLYREFHTPATVDMTARIKEALAGETRPVKAKPVGGLVRYLAQGAIAASVALVVLMAAEFVYHQDAGQIVPGSSVLAESTGSALNTTGDFQRAELTRMASLTEEFSLDEEARDRLQQTVYREFGQNNEAEAEIPVNYIIPVEK